MSLEDKMKEVNSRGDILMSHNKALVANFDSIYWIKKSIEDGNISEAVECWSEIPQSDQMKLWVAPTKGGVFTTHERKVIKDNAWSE